MALGSDRKIIEDTPSEIVRLMRLEMNQILDAVDALVVASQAADFAAFKVAGALIDTTVLRKLIATHERPAAPASTAV